MAEGKFVLPGAETITLTLDAARRLMGSGSGDAALLYLYILSSGGRFDREDAAARIGRTGNQVDAAMDVLARLGLVASEERPRLLERPDELPEYTTEDITRELSEGAAFRQLADEVRQALGRHLSTDDLKKLFGIYDYVGLPPEVILLLVTHCVEDCQRSGRMPTMRAIEKASYEWEREGVFSPEAVERYLQKLAETRSAEGKLARLLGLSGRSLSPSERKYLDAWTGMGFQEDAVSIAYDKTVLKTGRLTWRYMDSILKSWHQKGLHTAQEIEAGDAPRHKKQPGPAEAPSAPTMEEMEEIQEAIRRLREK